MFYESEEAAQDYVSDWDKADPGWRHHMPDSLIPYRSVARALEDSDADSTAEVVEIADPILLEAVAGWDDQAAKMRKAVCSGCYKYKDVTVLPNKGLVDVTDPRSAEPELDPDPVDPGRPMASGGRGHPPAGRRLLAGGPRPDLRRAGSLRGASESYKDRQAARLGARVQAEDRQRRSPGEDAAGRHRPAGQALGLLLRRRARQGESPGRSDGSAQNPVRKSEKTV